MLHRKVVRGRDWFLADGDGVSRHIVNGRDVDVATRSSSL